MRVRFNGRIVFGLLGLIMLVGSAARAEVQIPNPGFESWENFTPAYRASGENCVPGGVTVAEPTEWASWYDEWCDEAWSSYCIPCNYLKLETTTQDSYSGARSMKIGAAARVGWWEGTAIMYLPHDGGPLPIKLTGYYKKTGNPITSNAHYLDPQIFFLKNGTDLDDFAFCMQGMLSGCSLADPDAVVVEVREPPAGDTIPNLGAVSSWTYWERDIPEVPLGDAAEVGTIVVRFRHLAGNTSEFALVDDIAFEYPSLRCELEWNCDGVVNAADVLNFYDDVTYYPYAPYYPQFYEYLMGGIYHQLYCGLGAEGSMDFNEDGAIDMNDVLSFYYQWLDYENNKQNYYTLYPDSKCLLN